VDNSFVLVAFAYAAFTLGVLLFEIHRTRASGIDAISIFVAIFLLQCCFSAIAIFGLLPFVDRDNPTSVYAFNKILGQIDVTTGLLVFTLTAAFLLSFYLGCMLGRAGLARLWPRPPDVLLVSVRKWRISLTLLLGLALTIFSFMLLDDTMTGRYIKLVMLRSNDPTFVRTALNANAFSLTETWAWLTVIAIFCFIEARWRRILLPIFVAIAVLFALFGVSRRALFIPILMSYLTIALYSNKWRLRWILAAALPLVFWVAFGKNLIAAVAYGGSVDTVAAMYQSWQSAVIRAASDVGITVVESAGTVELIDLPPRLGGDHVLSMMKIFPERTLGLEVDYPERIVRISTAALDSPDAADLPPGLMGQMWLDFRLAGPLLWGIAFGLQISVIQWFFERTRCSRQSSAFFVVLVFIVALPLNTGSFDFTFSVNIVAIAIFLLICITVRRGRLVVARTPDERRVT
jgi:hypothetical protein